MPWHQWVTQQAGKEQGQAKSNREKSLSSVLGLHSIRSPRWRIVPKQAQSLSLRRGGGDCQQTTLPGTDAPQLQST